MSKPGNYTAYQQYKPIDDKISQSLQHWSSFYEQKRQNDIAQEQKDKALKNAKEKDDREWVDGLLKIDAIKATGVKDVDELNADISAKTYENRTALVEKLVTQKPGSSEYLKTMGLLTANGNIPKEINGIKNAVFENAKKYNEGRDNAYTVQPYLDDFYKNLDNAEIVIDPKTQKAVVLVQDPEDATKKITLTHQDILNGKGDFKLTPKFNMETMAKENAKLLNAKPNSKDRIDETTGYLLTEEGFDEPTIEQIAHNIMSDKDGKPTETAISFFHQKGIYDIAEMSKPENLKTLEKQYITEIDPFMISKNKIKPNTNELKRYKDETDAAYKRRMAAVAERNSNTTYQKGVGKGEIKEKITSASFTYGGKNKKGQATFGIEGNNYIVNNKKENTQEIVEGFDIDPNNPKSIIVRGYKVSKDDEGVEVREPFSYGSYNNPNEVLRFTSEANMNVRQMHQTLMGVAGLKYPKPTAAKPKAKPKPKPKAKPTANKVYGGIDANGNVIWK
jgi:hypothetical protein